MSDGSRPVALAIRNRNLLDDRIFQLPPDGPVDLSPYTPWRRVRELAAAAGLDLMTADRVAARGIDPRDVVLLAYDWTPASEALVAQGAVPAVLTSLEPPVIAWQMYFRLRALTARFAHAFVWPGASRRVHPACTYHPLYYPQVRVYRTAARPWAERRWLVMIGSNKAMVRSLTRFFDRPREVSLKREAAAVLYPPIGRDLYLERLRAIAAFADQPGFDLFGQGWDRRHPAVPLRLHQAALKAVRGPVREKLAVLSDYQFALCFENSRFPGYISEKIFDCFFTGTIPLYLGAPDVARYIPPDSYVDLTRFASYAEVQRFLRSVSPSEAQRYLDAALAFLEGPEYQRFTVDAFARGLVGALASVADATEPGGARVAG